MFLDFICMEGMHNKGRSHGALYTDIRLWDHWSQGAIYEFSRHVCIISCIYLSYILMHSNLRSTHLAMYPSPPYSYHRHRKHPSSSMARIVL